MYHSIVIMLSPIHAYIRVSTCTRVHTHTHTHTCTLIILCMLITRRHTDYTKLNMGSKQRPEFSKGKKKRAYSVWFDVCKDNNKKSSLCMVWCMRREKKELTVCGSTYVKEKQQQSFQCKVQCMQRKNNNRAYSVWFDVCEGKTTTELTVYGSMYVKEKTTELTVCGSMYVKEKQQ